MTPNPDSTYTDRVSFILDHTRGKTLDVGYVACTLHPFIQKEVGIANTFGIDIEPVPTGYDPAHYKKGSAESLPFEDNQFDTVTAGELIEHLENPARFVAEAHRVLKKNGALILTTPNRKSWVNRAFKSYNTKIHLSLFTPDELQDLLHKNHFRWSKFVFFPFTEESSPGASQKWFYPIRAFLHPFMPGALQEEMAIVALKLPNTTTNKA